MQGLKNLIDIFLHIDKHLGLVISEYHFWTYGILFVIIFCETGLVITPFLPGDSLLFAAGSFAAIGALDPIVLFVIISIAAIIGDTVNYWIGNKIGKRVFTDNIRFLKKEYLEKTHRFYEKHGGKTIIIARFIPIIRTFAPFVAGIGAMSYSKFIIYNVVGGLLWTSIFISAGYFFGTLPFVKNNFGLVVIAIIIISVVPIIIELVKSLRSKARG
ncbi:MAG: DedA family protein [Candidatus Kapabacteria bacterium]|nr:DedA family protein [Candidatus Kapabacteria bacterium]